MEDRIEKLRELHGKLHAHPFRSQPTWDNWNDYRTLFDEIYGIISRHYFESVTDHSRYAVFLVDGEPERCCVHVWKNPNIALINYSYREYDRLKTRILSKHMLDDNYLYRFLVLTETVLTLLHSYIDGKEMTSAAFETDDPLKDADTVKYVYSEKFGGWVLE